MSENEYVLKPMAVKKAEIVETMLQKATEDEKFGLSLLDTMEKSPREALAVLSENTIDAGEISEETLSRMLLPVQFYLQNRKYGPAIDHINRVTIGATTVASLDPKPFVEPPPLTTQHAHFSGLNCKAALANLESTLKSQLDAIKTMAECMGKSSTGGEQQFTIDGVFGDVGTHHHLPGDLPEEMCMKEKMALAQMNLFLVRELAVVRVACS